MPGRAGTATKDVVRLVGAGPEWSKKGSISIKWQRNAGTGWDGHKTAVRLLGAVPEWSKKGNHIY